MKLIALVRDPSFDSPRIYRGSQSSLRDLFLFREWNALDADGGTAPLERPVAHVYRLPVELADDTFLKLAVDLPPAERWEVNSRGGYIRHLADGRRRYH